MPRFENEGFDSGRSREDIDRTVPEEENYYGYSPVDLDFNNKTRDDSVVKDNQRSGINPCDDSGEDGRHFVSESYDDFERPQKSRDRHGSGSRGSGGNHGSHGRRSADKNGSGKGGKKKKNKKSGRLSAGKKVLIVILVLLLIIVGAAAPVLGRINYDDKKDNEYVTQSELADSAMVKNVLLLGVDARSGEDSEASRSDTMMLVSLDMKHHCVKLVSFLRDTWVYIPSLGYEQRLNAACSDGGYQNVADTIEYNFGINIDSYIVTDFEMFKVLVDSLGGVEVDVTKAEAKEVTNHPKRYGGVTLPSGKNNLSGEQALAYCRIRKIDTDFERTKRQRTVMSAILDTAKHSNPFKLYKMAFNSAPYIETSMSKGELIGFAAGALYCITGELHQTKVPFEGTWDYATIQGNSIISINTEKNKEMLEEYIYTLSSKDITEQENED